MLGALLEPSSPRVEVVHEVSKDVTGAIVERIAPGSHAMAVMATGRMASGRHSNGSQVMKVVERSLAPVLVERAGARRPLAVAPALGVDRA